MIQIDSKNQLFFSYYLLVLLLACLSARLKSQSAYVIRSVWFISAFMLVMRVENNRDLLINFTAVEFVSYLDDAIFLLGEIAEAVVCRSLSCQEYSNFVSLTPPDLCTFPFCITFIIY